MMIDGETCEITEEIFESPLQRHQKRLEESIKEVNLLLIKLINIFTIFII